MTSVQQRMSRLLVPGDTAPTIQSQAVKQGEVVDLTLDDALSGADFLLLVFYPADFTFVCPTEIVQFAEKRAEFQEQRCNIVCCSTDSVYTHLAWLKAPKAERGLGATNSSSIVLLSDRSHEISRAYGVLAASGAAYRGTFLIDKSKTICQVTINDMPVGRSVDDALRMLTELRERTPGCDKGRQIASNDRQVNSSNARTSVLELNRQHHMRQAKQLHQRRQPRQQQQQQQEDSMPIRQMLPHTAGLNPAGIAAATGSFHYAAAPRHDGKQQNNQCEYQQSEQQQRQQQRQQQQSSEHQAGLVTQAAQLETRAAQLRLKDSEDRLARVLAEADRLLAAAEQQRSDTERLKAEARLKQTEWDRLLRRSFHGCDSGAPGAAAPV